MSATSIQSVTPSATWAFNPTKDTFSKDALFDLRSLNEVVAGQSGFVRRSADGNDMVLGNGAPARFWAVTTYVQRLQGMETLEHHARWLAKRGVNMARFHGQISPKGEDPIDKPNMEEIDQAWKLVAAMKKQGIYTTISPFWAIPVSKIPASWNVEGYTGESAAGLLFFDKTMQEGYKAWARVLFGQENPHTGIPLADDPAVALIQIQNEDSMLFWTMQGVKGKQLENLRTLFGNFLKKKYGSLDAARAAWGNDNPATAELQDNQADDWANGRPGIFIVWEWTQTPGTRGPATRAKRFADQLQFYGETMHKFNAEMADFYRKELGCKQLINAGNWKTADPIKLEDVERWSYTANEVIGVNRYFDSVHFGPRNGWAADAGDTFTNTTALLDPRAFPLNVKQVAGHPFIISESHWVPPTIYQSEGPFLTAAYQSLTGLDTYYWFAIGDGPEWQAPFGKWNIGTPMELGQFPAAALMFRQGHIQRGKPVVQEERSLQDLWNRADPLIAEDKSFDPNRDAVRGGKTDLQNGVNPLAFLVGPVQVKYGGDAKNNQVVDVSKSIDDKKKTVRSITGELNFNHAAGLCTLNAPKAQGATGFLKKSGTIKLRDVTIQSRNEYSTITVVGMDNQPLSVSRKILVQVGTTQRPTGWQDKDATFNSPDGKETYVGKQIVNVGSAPWQIVATDATLSIRNSVLKTATVVDTNGMAAGTLAGKRNGGAFTVTLPRNALYVVLQ
jgi:hypothetical protein